MAQPLPKHSNDNAGGTIRKDQRGPIPYKWEGPARDRSKDKVPSLFDELKDSGSLIFSLPALLILWPHLILTTVHIIKEWATYRPYFAWLWS